MPTEKNAAFLPTQYSFKLDRQRVKTHREKLNIVSIFVVAEEVPTLKSTKVVVQNKLLSVFLCKGAN